MTETEPVPECYFLSFHSGIQKVAITHQTSPTSHHHDSLRQPQGHCETHQFQQDSGRKRRELLYCSGQTGKKRSGHFQQTVNDYSGNTEQCRYSHREKVGSGFMLKPIIRVRHAVLRVASGV